MHADRSDRVRLLRPSWYPASLRAVYGTSVFGKARDHAAFIWSIAGPLRRGYKKSGYGKVILPLTMPRRLDRVHASAEQQVLDRHERLRGRLFNAGPLVTSIAGAQFWNASELDPRRVLDKPHQ